MTTTPNMGLTKPTLGGSSGEWDDDLNESLDAIDAHDHTAGNGKRVPVDGFSFDEDLPAQGHGITGLGRIAFSQIAAPSDAISLFVNTADNELYWRTFSGTNVKLTSGSTLNTSLVGGIVGDYSTVGAEIAYDDANDRYTFKQQGAPKTWARLASGSVRIYETGTTESVFVGLNTPGALAASYDITWPLAVPASTSLMLMDASGNVTVTNTHTNAVTFSTLAGNPSFSAGLTVPTGQVITLAGTARVARGARTLTYPVLFNTVDQDAGTISDGNPGASWAVSSAGNIPLPALDAEGASQTVSEFKIYNALSGAGTVTVEAFYVSDSAGGFVSAAASQAIAVANPIVYTAAVAALATGRVLWLRITTPGTISGRVWAVAVTSAVP